MKVIANRFEIEALVGRGAMGEVHRARDLVLGDTVAIKTLMVDPRDAIGALAMFKQEVRLARRVTHKNVARVFDCVEDDGALFLTMELVEGETLAELLAREGRLPLERAVSIALETCAGLAAVHAAGIVHRDLKPSNVLIEHAREGGEPRVVLTDFGGARSTLEVASQRAMIVGTPQYMAPEQATGIAVDARADIWSLGVVLGEMHAQVTRAGTPSSRAAAWRTPARDRPRNKSRASWAPSRARAPIADRSSSFHFASSDARPTAGSARSSPTS